MPVILKNAFLLLAGLLLLSTASFAQAEADSLAAYDSDELFVKGREAAFTEQRELARIYLNRALAKSPEYDGIRIFLARTWLWDDNRRKAEEVMQPLLENDPGDAEVARLMFDAAYWNDDTPTALQWAERGLKQNATDKDLLLKKARALGELERYNDAILVLDGLLQRFPGDQAALELWENFSANSKVNSVTAIANYDFYSEIFGNASLYGLQYGRRTSLGSVFLRANQSNRFGGQGWQGEIDAYPSLGKNMYAYLNYGFSPTALFPEQRAGAELYASLPLAFEASLGFRYLYFGSDASVLMYTATVGKYYKSYWFSARVFLTPDKAGLSQSLILQARRYFSNSNHYIGISGGFGFSPDFRNLQSSEGLSSAEIYRLKSNRLGLAYQHPFGSSWQATANLDYARQEFIFDTGDFVGIWSVMLALRYSF